MNVLGNPHVRLKVLGATVHSVVQSLNQNRFRWLGRFVHAQRTITSL